MRNLTGDEVCVLASLCGFLVRNQHNNGPGWLENRDGTSLRSNGIHQNLDLHPEKGKTTQTLCPK